MAVMLDPLLLEKNLAEAAKLLKRGLPEDLDTVIRNSAMRTEQIDRQIDMNEGEIKRLTDETKDLRRQLREFARQRSDAEKAKRRTASYRRRSRRAALARSATAERSERLRRRRRLLRTGVS